MESNIAIHRESLYILQVWTTSVRWTKYGPVDPTGRLKIGIFRLGGKWTLQVKNKKFKLRFELFKNSSFELEMILGSLLHLKAQLHVLAHIGNCADNCTHTRPVEQ